jgi:phytoene synthase
MSDGAFGDGATGRRGDGVVTSRSEADGKQGVREDGSCFCAPSPRRPVAPSRPAVALEESYRHCRAIARAQARNFYYSFVVLPTERRNALCAVYAFMRYCDDISDGGAAPASKRELLEAWRGALAGAYRGEYGGSRILPAFHDTVRRFDIPQAYFDALIDGAQMDLTVRRYETFEDLYQYCYRVASVVGLVCIEIFGYQDARAREYAESCGIAFQLTNILRDVKEDGERGRIYLPLNDLRRFDYPEEDLFRSVVNDHFLRLMQFEVARAREYYQRALPLLPLIDRGSRPALQAMMAIYGGILTRIEQSGYDVFAERAQLSHWEKVSIAARAWLGSRLGAGAVRLQGREGSD